MRRTINSKSLKRVDGDAYLASQQIDPNRPITSGAPLRRCSNDTSISQRHYVPWPSTPSTLSQISTTRESGYNESSSRLSSGYSPPFSKPSEKYYEVPTNTAAESSETRSRSSVVTTKSTSEVRVRNVSRPTRSIRLTPEKSRFPTIKAYRATRSLHTSSTSSKNDEFPLDDYIKTNDMRDLQKSGVLTYKNYYSHNGSGTPSSTGRLENESPPISLSTESSLNFPVSDEKIPQTRSAEWSLKNQVATAPRKTSSETKPKPEVFRGGHNVEMKSSENIHAPNDTITASSQIGDGDGDGDFIKTPGSEQASDQEYCLVPFIPLPGPSTLHHTPPQTSASAANKTGFSLTFRKPKLHHHHPRPRSIVTNSSSNKGSSLPTTASTPNPMSPGIPVTPVPPPATKQESKKKTMVQDDNGNNNNNSALVNTQSKSKKSLKKASVKDGNVAIVVLPADVTYESAAIVAEVEPSSSEAVAPDVYDPDESFWKSDSSSSEEKAVVGGAPKVAGAAKPHGHHPHKHQLGHAGGHHHDHAGTGRPFNAHHHDHAAITSIAHAHPQHHDDKKPHEHHHEGHGGHGGFEHGHNHEGPGNKEHHHEVHVDKEHPHEVHDDKGHGDLEHRPEEYVNKEPDHEGNGDKDHPEEKESELQVDQEPHPDEEKVETPPPKEEAGSENKTEPLSIRTVSVPVSAPKGLSASKSSSIKTYPSSSGYGYPPSYETGSSSIYKTATQTTTTTSPTEPDGPFLRTEKGAIRFHLPGRIQHKTTIKVAHFPTGDDKNIVLNVNKDNTEEEACEEMMPPNCANNQNFVVPPQYASYPPQSYNPYSMYGDVSPYSLADYYRYYGYSTPPYC